MKRSMSNADSKPGTRRMMPVITRRGNKRETISINRTDLDRLSFQSEDLNLHLNRVVGRLVSEISTVKKKFKKKTEKVILS